MRLAVPAPETTRVSARRRKRKAKGVFGPTAAGDRRLETESEGVPFPQTPTNRMSSGDLA
jgi:hypothetical protein